MNTKRFSMPRVLKAAACAAVLGFMGSVATSTASASLVTFNLVATGGNNVSVSGDGKTVTTTGANPTVNYSIQAIVHETQGNGSQAGFLAGMGSVAGSGTLSGTQVGQNVAPFNSSNALPGTPNGSSLGFDTGTARANDGTSFYAQSSTLDYQTGTAAQTGDVPFTIGTGTFTVTPGGSGQETLQWVNHIDTNTGSGGRFFQFELDGHTYQLNGNGTGRQDLTTPFSSASAFDTGAPITINPTPEPASLALIGLGGVGLLMRRRRA